MSGADKALSHHYGRLDMHGNRIMNVEPPVYPNDVEVHGHTHTANDVGAIPTTEKNQPNGVPVLDSLSYINNAQIPIFVEQIIADQIIVNNKAVELQYNIDITKPVEFIIYSIDGYRSLSFVNNIDYEIVDNILSWELSDLHLYITEGDTLYISYFKVSD